MADADNLNGGARLRPDMSSRRLQVLTFVHDYIAEHHGSPSHREIANHCGISKMRVLDHLRALERAGELLRTPGPRGLALPDRRDAAMHLLRRLGYAVLPTDPCPETGMLSGPPLDYPSPRQRAETADGAGGKESKRRRAGRA